MLRRELAKLDKIGRNITLNKYNPVPTEMHIQACCKRHPNCRHKVECLRLWDEWSERAPVSYEPIKFERMMGEISPLFWIPVLILGLQRDSWELPQSRLIEEV